MKLLTMPLCWVLVLVIGLTVDGCASHQRTVESAAPAPDRPSSEKALIYFYRPKKRRGWSSGYAIRDNGAEIGRLRAGFYFAYAADPGQHRFSASADSAPTTLEVEARHTYYLRTDVEEEFWVTPPHLTVVDPAQGPSAIEPLQRGGR